MAFNSIKFILFFTAVFILYYLLPKKAELYLLLAASLYFYANAGPVMLIYLIICSLATYFLGIAICRAEPGCKRSRFILSLGIIIDVATLCIFKYTNFGISILNRLFSTSIQNINLIAPLGISFITFETISYLVDTSRRTIAPERNFLKFMLFIAFFPKVVQGPIEKAGDMLPQFEKKHKFVLENVREGIIMFLFGLAMKMVIADRAATAVDTVFSNIKDYSGAAVLFADILFTVQLYADFAGYSLIAIGSAKMLGFEMRTNFAQPYFSVSVAEFWRRWHISLNNWLKDYVYIPLGGSRCSKLHKYCNLMITFLISGIWHGAAIGFVFWGGLNGLYVTLENISKDISKKMGKALFHFPETVNRIKTVVLVTFAWGFFRAQSFDNVKLFLMKILTDFRLRDFRTSFYKMMANRDVTLMGMNRYQFYILFISLIILFFIDRMLYRNEISAESIACGNRAVRWMVLFFLIFSVLIFGVYGYGYSAAAFIYTNF